MSSDVTPIRWDEESGTLELLDQLRLPSEFVYRSHTNEDEVADSIRRMVVRGAPAIGVAAAFGMVLAASGAPDRARLARAGSLLKSTRPTAVNLAWAIDRILEVAAATKDGELFPSLLAEAKSILAEDIRNNRSMGLRGQELLPARGTILTHCNAGALATGGFGTALGLVRAAREAGKEIAVFADETRPFLQGARLTAWELQQDGFDVTLITDSMSGHFFQKKTFDAVIVGADRIAANGDTANKIGTYTLAVLARAHDVPFYVAAPRSTFDLECSSGEMIPIEERSASEVTHTEGFDSSGLRTRVQLAPDGVRVRHPAFDVTPAELITRIITEREILEPPFPISISKAFANANDHH